MTHGTKKEGVQSVIRNMLEWSPGIKKTNPRNPQSTNITTMDNDDKDNGRDVTIPCYNQQQQQKQLSVKTEIMANIKIYMNI